MEGKLNTYERAIKDAQSKIDQLHLRGADPMAGGNDSWAEGRQRQQQQRPEPTERTPDGSQHYHMPSGDPPLRTGPWKLYDEKCLFQPTTAYTGKDTQTWLQDFHDYLSGRTADLDRLFKYVKSQTEEIKSPDIGFMLDLPATMGEVSRQLWALLGGLAERPRRHQAPLRQRAPA